MGDLYRHHTVMQARLEWYNMFLQCFCAAFWVVRFSGHVFSVFPAEGEERLFSFQLRERNDSSATCVALVLLSCRQDHAEGAVSFV